MVITMHINDTIKNFLYDQKYFITMYDEVLYVFNYINLLKINKDEIILEFKDFKLIIWGMNFYITKMTKNEMKIKGIINKVEYKYE